MKKRMIGYYFLTIALLFSLASCGSQEPPEEPAAVCPIGTEDTYWTAYEWSFEEEDPNEVIPMEADQWKIDLLICQDGTARFRDMYDEFYLVDHANLSLSWEKTLDDHYLFYNNIQTAPVLEGTWEDGVLSLSYTGTTLSMKQDPLPEGPGQFYVPAELAGTWLMVSGENEGDTWKAMPDQLVSLTFRYFSDDQDVTLVADWESRSGTGSLYGGTYQQELEILTEPLYEGCENQDWCVRMGPESSVGEDGFPTNPEFYVTLLDRDTLLMQQYFSFEEGSGVSYQTYRRMPDTLTWWDVTEEELTDTRWECVGYLDPAGKELPMPPGLEDLYLHLSEDVACWFGSLPEGEETWTDQPGTWMLGKGGVILLQGTGEQDYWYGGAVSAFMHEEHEAYLDDYELFLYDQGGIIKLDFTGYG